MINKDYILRLAEKMGRALAIILGLREYNQYEEALISIDDLLLKTVGLTSRFLNALPEEMVLQTFSPLGVLNIESCLWAAALLKAEGEIYDDLNNPNESYYRYLKSLSLFLAVLTREHIEGSDIDFYQEVEELLHKLAEYEIPLPIKKQLVAYYERLGRYATAEDILFELLEAHQDDHSLAESGEEFYTRLLKKSNTDLLAGNLTREEVEEGLAALKQKYN